jgi:hypothetical protein
MLIGPDMTVGIGLTLNGTELNWIQYQPLPMVGKCSYDKMTILPSETLCVIFLTREWTENYNQPLSLSTSPTTQYYIANFFSKPLRIWRDTQRLILCRKGFNSY